MSISRGLLLLLAFGLAAAMDPVRMQHEQHLMAVKASPREHFLKWATQHTKPYLEAAGELEQRFKTWTDNLEYVLEYNAVPGRTHWLGMTKLADLSPDEYRQLLGYNHTQRKAENRMLRKSRYADLPEDALPVQIDWRKQGAVTPVKNQQQCGSCWAFSTTGSVEGINAIVTKQLQSLSEQELVDCDKLQDKGCHGGLMDYAFEFIIKNGGIDTEEDYPYTAEEGQCIASKRNRHVVSIDGYEDVPENSEIALKKAVAHQPVSVAIEADQKAFQLYAGGVFADTECGTQLDHGVLVVGYGRDPKGVPYWIVKNSWGAEWGEQGYIRIKAMTRSKEGMCGIAMAASYPVKTGPNPDPTPTPGPGPKPGPKPKPTPVQCDGSTECPPKSTCCCVNDLFGLCLQWGCCPIEDATCCDDNEHCCPPELPVCDTAAGRCLAGRGTIEGSQPWLTKTPATRVGGFWDKVFGRRAGMAQQ